MTYDSLVNRGEYFSAHYLAEVLPNELKKKDGIRARWAAREDAGGPSPAAGLRALKSAYTNDRLFFADTLDDIREGVMPKDADGWRKALHELHGDVLRALGFSPVPQELTIVRGDKQHTVQVAHAEPTLVAIECGWAPDVDAAFDPEQAGLLLSPVELDGRERIDLGDKLATWLFGADEQIRFVLILAGGVIILADRMTWGEGRYLAVSLDVALGRGDTKELETIGALFGADSLLPPEEGGAEPLSEFLDSSRQHAVGVSKELREGLRKSVEIIANEVLDRIREQGHRPEDIMEPKELGRELSREALRYLYRILFLLYAEARPELGILPTDDEAYIRGYSLARLGDLVVRDLVGEQSRQSVHLYESLDLLFQLVNGDHPSQRVARPRGTSEGEGLRFEPLKAELFEHRRTKLIGKDAIVLDEDDPDSPRIDTRLRNSALHQVLRLLMLTKGKRKERGGFISYAQLGINQLGAVYEGLMSYTGFIAKEELYEVAKNGDPKDGSWMITRSQMESGAYAEDVFVMQVDENGVRTNERVRYRPGSFVYRLAGRDRQTSASYYTPPSLTKVTVELALKERLDQNGTTTSAREILNWTICEPALGSGAFLNEAIDQVAAEYLKRRQGELGQELEPERYLEELQKVKAYIALHNAYGVDLNETAVELAEVSLWLNVMHPGLQAPWFGLHLRRGNSLIGAGRRVYEPHHLKRKAWLSTAPKDIPFRDGAIPDGHIHHFLLPASGWGAVASEKEAKNLAPDDAKRLAAWRKELLKDPSTKKKQGHKLTQVQRLQAITRRAEFLWDLVVQRLKISEREISRRIDVWGAEDLPQPQEAISRDEILADLTAPGTPYWRLKTVMDVWCALWFWPLHKANLLDGSANVYRRFGDLETSVIEVTELVEPEPDPGFPTIVEQDSLFGGETKQLPLRGSLTAGRGGKTRSRTLDPVRAIIPLAHVDDWLDFAEATLGRADVPPNSIPSALGTLGALSEYEDELPKWTGMDSADRLAARFPWLDAAQDVAEELGFFHWELQFAQVFQRGGFDLQVGNPPWVRPDWEEDIILAELEPWFKLATKPSLDEWRDRKTHILSTERAKSYFLDELSSTAGTVAFLGGETTYPLLNGTRPDLYRAFMCRTWKNLSITGNAGLIHPDSHFGGVKEGRLRAATFRHLRLHGHFHNRRAIFPEIHANTEFGVHVYGASRNISFTNASWLFDPVTLIESFRHDGSGELPGIKHDGKWDLRPHKDRLLHVDYSLLEQWRALTDSIDAPVDQTPLLYPVTTAEAGAIEALTKYARRLAQDNPNIAVGLDEAKAKKDGLIQWNTAARRSLSEVILQGPHFNQATPFNKQPNIPCKTNRDWLPWNIAALPDDAVPVTNYERACDLDTYLAAQDQWTTANGDVLSFNSFYRLAWRARIPFDTERSLFATIIPPGPSHVNQVHSLALSDNQATVLTAGFWAALPLDYLLRVIRRPDLHISDAKRMPAASPAHPLVQALLLRTLRLNCLTSAFTDLWAELYSPDWRRETWAVDWPALPALGNVTYTWGHTTPLRTERERRAALVEIDALVALWLGITADQLVAIYRSRFPVLSDYEAQTWFDATGRKIAGNHNAFGYGQTKADFEALKAHLTPEINGPVPEGYEAPFYKADREAEYRQAHAAFSKRLERAQTEGWTPDKGIKA
ncbi:class I SAM-dependent DNA methyltransferase [Actinomadura gamaensis]|uniref:site-specific DNA-methyltransferase (adenine-specific) n=1 Tax=Actinomadura gamaensis TaxID=1763541 RepID=A0ABV9U2V3_9ACTN